MGSGHRPGVQGLGGGTELFQERGLYPTHGWAALRDAAIGHRIREREGENHHGREYGCHGRSCFQAVEASCP
eukprot:2027414-Lingulodinium_polyedra.AAC.1